MGASVCFTNHIEIADKSKVFGPIKCIGYNDITPKMINDDFIKELHLHTFRLLYCGNSDLSKLGEFESLRELELWRILKLENIDFISSLINLEILKLQDLNRINSLPDLSRLAKLKKIRLYNVPIDKKSLDKDIEKLIC